MERRGMPPKATPISRQGYLPDLSPLLDEATRARLRVPRSFSSPEVRSPPQLDAALKAYPSRPPDALLLELQQGLLPRESAPAERREGEGSISGTVFNMCSSTLGAGALSLPLAISQTGLLLGPLLLLVTAVATHYSCDLLVSALIQTNARSYEQLTVRLYGKRAGVLVELNIIIFCFGTVVAYTVAVGDILLPLIRMPGVAALCPWLDRSSAMCIVWLLVMLPVSLADSMSQLQCTSLFGVAALSYLVLSVVAHALADSLFDARLDETFELTPHAAPRLVNASEQSVSALAIIMFAFTCQVNVPLLYDELKHRSAPRMRTVSRFAMALCLILYSAIGVAGYADFGGNVQGNLLDNYSIGWGSLHARMMLPAFMAIALTVLMAYPLNIYPCRYALDVMICGGLGERFRRSRHVAWTLLLSCAGLLTALYVPGINVVFQLLGGTSSAFVCFMLPAAFGWSLDLQQVRGAGRLACASLFLAGLAVGIGSTAVTLHTLFEPA
ncbi:hypothetical protein AB1Y20_022844 [Prymnesium parvum]|uniref:Amino acid transporter transmembrane domain-containing protein n=1 Tax=Prymnesium parvum TaxID=97485 RepID=A0AB34JDA6_PRYPA